MKNKFNMKILKFISKILKYMINKEAFMNFNAMSNQKQMQVYICNNYCRLKLNKTIILIAIIN